MISFKNYKFNSYQDPWVIVILIIDLQILIVELFVSATSIDIISSLCPTDIKIGNELLILFLDLIDEHIISLVDSLLFG